jgi:hypothetical protein
MKLWEIQILSQLMAFKKPKTLSGIETKRADGAILQFLRLALLSIVSPGHDRDRGRQRQTLPTRGSSLLGAVTDPPIKDCF